MRLACLAVAVLDYIEPLSNPVFLPQIVAGKIAPQP
jgi:hypothetical protein